MTTVRVLAALVRASPHVLLGALCLGLALPVFVPAPPGAWTIAVAAGVAALAALSEDALRLALLAVALLLLGIVWGGSRVARLDASVLANRIGEAGPALLATTSPVRRGAFAVRVVADVRRWRREPMREPVLLELPLGRAPPQGTLLEVVAEIRAPRLADEADGFDERAWLRRQGIQVVLRAQHARMVGHRGGLASVPDRLRAWLERSLGPGLRGERRAVLAGVVLGADEGIADDLRDRFRASGLYHLLTQLVSGRPRRRTRQAKGRSRTQAFGECRTADTCG